MSFQFRRAKLLLTSIEFGQLILGVSEINNHGLTLFNLSSNFNALQKILVHELPDHSLIFSESISHSFKQISNENTDIVLFMNYDFVGIIVDNTVQDTCRILILLVGDQHGRKELSQLMEENLRLLEFDFILVIQVLVLGDLHQVVIFRQVIQNLTLHVWQKEECLENRVSITRVSNVCEA